MKASSSCGTTAPDGKRDERAVHFTPRQFEVLALLCEGCSNKEISRRLGMSGGTVKIHMSCILRQLGAANRVQAVVVAKGLGLVPVTVAEAPRKKNGADVSGVLEQDVVRNDDPDTLRLA